MGLYNHNISSLSGGVSQQPDAERFDNQVESMENFHVTTAQGLRKRNPLELVVETSLDHHESMAVHSYNRGDGIRKYSITLCEHGVKIYDQSGTDLVDREKTVIGGLSTDPVLSSWIASATAMGRPMDWEKDIEFLTAGDTTWILNTRVPVEASSVIPGVSVSYFTYTHVNSVVLQGGPNTEIDDYLNGYLRLNFSYNGIASTRNSSSWNEVMGYGETKDVTTIARDLLEAEVNSISSLRWQGSGIAYDTALTSPITVSFTFVGSSGSIKSQSTTVGTESALSNTEGKTAFYWIYKSFDEGADTSAGFSYSVTIHDGSTTEPPLTYTANSDNSITAAVSLRDQINNGSSRFSAANVGSILKINSLGSGEFTIETGDSYGNQASRSWLGSIAKISDLPADMSGFTTEEVGTIAVTGTDTDSFTSYYLKWEDDHWTETHKFGEEESILNITMPAKLLQVDDDTFELGWIDWESRYKGDVDSAPSPSFIGSTISNMFFFKNRLGFTSEDNVILSEAGVYYNFYPTTVMEILDSDPIDAGVDSNTVSMLRNVNATAGALTLWADNAQFLLSGGEILSPATTRIAQTSSYTAYNDIKPMVVDNEIIFFNKLGSWLDVLSYNPASLQADKSSAESISAHVPTYLPATISSACASPAHNLMFLFNKQENDSIYCYKYYIYGGERRISAWFKWKFDFSKFYSDEETGTLNISSIDVLDNELFVYAAYNKIFRMFLEPMDVDAKFGSIPTNEDGSIPDWFYEYFPDYDDNPDEFLGKFKDFYNVDGHETSYNATVVLSRYNVMTSQTARRTRTTREPFYLKNVKVNKSGKVDFKIINEERSRETIIDDKHLSRKLVVGGNSYKVNIGLTSDYNTGCEINTISLEGRLQSKSKNI